MSGPGRGGARPRLAAVPPSADPAPPSGAAPPARSDTLVWVLAAALALLAGALAVEARRAGVLAERLQASETRLAGPRPGWPPTTAT